jgi:hypothetical protein
LIKEDSWKSKIKGTKEENGLKDKYMKGNRCLVKDFGVD